MRDDNYKRFIPDVENSENVALRNEILRMLVGSSMTGVTGPNSISDEDFCAIFIEPPEYVLGFKHQEHYTYRSKPEGVRSEPGDIDFTSYSLRKFMSLALAGNPQIIMMLFAGPQFITHIKWPGHELMQRASLLISKKAGPRYLGYMESQHKRLIGELKGHMPKRPELIDQFGFDTKYAAHALRLGFQGQELMDTGIIRVPIPHDPGDYLRAVRAGEYSLAHVVEDIEVVKDDLKRSIERSSLPEEPDYAELEPWMVNVHQSWWHRNEWKF